MEAFIGFNAIYLLTAVPLTVIIYLIFRLYYKVTEWYYTDLFLIIMPGNLYLILDKADLDKLLNISKSLGNMVELMFIGIGCGLIFLLRAILGKKFPNYSRRFSLLGVLLMVVLTVFVYIFTPSLPE